MRWNLIHVPTDGKGRDSKLPYHLQMEVEPGDDDFYPPHREAEKWCGHQFGFHDHDRWRNIGSFNFGFRDHADAVAFKMRWG